MSKRANTDHEIKYVVGKRGENDMYGQLFSKIRNSLPVTHEVKDSVIARIIFESFVRIEQLDFKDKGFLLDDNLKIHYNSDTKCVDFMEDSNLFGIYWSFDIVSGELVGT